MSRCGWRNARHFLQLTPDIYALYMGEDEIWQIEVVKRDGVFRFRGRAQYSQWIETNAVNIEEAKALAMMFFAVNP